MEPDDNYDGILRKALAIDDLPQDFDPKKIPQTGEEYIHYVMYEAKQCKEWVTSDINQEKFKNKQTTIYKEPGACVGAPEELLPSATWQQNQVSDFSAFRTHLKRIKQHFNTSNSTLVTPQFNGESKQWYIKCSQKPPSLTDLFQLNQRGICKVLSYHLDWLEEIKPADCLPRTISIWLYALLACLETPLMPETCADLREIARKCSHIRSQLSEHPNEIEFKPLNLIICLIARYFNNLDLIDH